MTKKKLAQRSYTRRTNQLLIHLFFSLTPAPLVAWALWHFHPAEGHPEDCAFLNWDVDYAQEGRFKDKGFARCCQWNTSSLKTGLLATLATSWGQSAVQCWKAWEKGSWHSSTHHSLLHDPPRNSGCATFFPKWLKTLEKWPGSCPDPNRRLPYSTYDRPHVCCNIISGSITCSWPHWTKHCQSLPLIRIQQAEV